MAEYDNTNSGALFKNDEKNADHPNWPDYKGSIDVEGKEFWINAWLKKSKAGRNYMSLSVTPKEAVHNKGMEQAREAVKSSPAPSDGFVDDIPFN